MKKHNAKPEFDAEGYQIDMRNLNGEALPNLADLKFKPFAHGGMRPGAGRKPSGREPVLLRLRPAIVRRLRSVAKKQGKTLSEVAEASLSAELLVQESQAPYGTKTKAPAVKSLTKKIRFSERTVSLTEGLKTKKTANAVYRRKTART